MNDGRSTAPERPADVVARARALAGAGDNVAALQLLQSRRGAWQRVPPVYEALLGRFLLRTGDAKEAIAPLIRARDAYDGKMPAEQRRDLGLALLQAGRFEAAGQEFVQVEESGAKIVKAAHRSAIEAFRHRAGAEPDAGPPTPYRILAQAQTLAEAKKLDAARRLLLEHAAGAASLPAAYEAMLGQLLLRAGDRQQAALHLMRARDSNPDGLPTLARQALGIALFETGRFAEAAPELDRALQAGAQIARCDLFIAINDYRRRTGSAAPVSTIFAKNLALVDQDKRLVYVSIPKNACSLLKATYILNSNQEPAWRASGQTVHEFCGNIVPGLTQDELTNEAGYFRFIVLRDPLRRLVSAYLDKFVRQRDNPESYPMMQLLRTIRAAQGAAGIAYDPIRSISFEEFVRWIAGADDVELDLHWMPQVHMAGTDLGLYDHVGTVERLGETLDLLESRFGYVAPESLENYTRTGARHVTKFDAGVTVADPHRLLPEDLEMLEAAMPVAARFYTPELKLLVRKRYAADVALLEQAARLAPPVASS